MQTEHLAIARRQCRERQRDGLERAVSVDEFVRLQVLAGQLQRVIGYVSIDRAITPPPELVAGEIGRDLE